MQISDIFLKFKIVADRDDYKNIKNQCDYYSFDVQ